MAEIVPAVLAATPDEYATLLQRATSLSSRIQIDLTDGEFAPSRTINLVQAYWPDDVQADIHLMYERPGEYTQQLISMKPHLVIIHQEAASAANYSNEEMLKELKAAEIKVGMALLGTTPVGSLMQYLYLIDHILIFAGKLGFYGGSFDSTCLDKVKEVKALRPDLEVGWDGGINDQTISAAVKAGADVLNVGSYVSKADDPKAAYQKLAEAVAA